MKKLKQILLVGLMLVSIVTGNTIHADDAELKPGEVYTKSYAKWANKSDAEKGIAQINIELYGKNKLQATDIAYVVDLSESMLTEDMIFHSPILGDYTVSELLPYQKTAWKQAREASTVFFQQMLTGEGNEENQIALVPFSSDVYNETYANEGYNFWARHEWLYCTEKSQSIKETKSCQIGDPNTYVMKVFTVNPSFDPATDELTAFGKDFLKKYGYSENDIKKVEGKANTLPLTNDIKALENNLMSAFPYASTNYVAAMNQAENYLFSGDQAENGHRKVIVFISDGVPNNVDESIARAEELKKRGIEFYTIGTNVTDTAKSTLSTISKDLQGKEHYVDASTETLGEAISSLSGEIKIAGTNAKISDSINTKAFHYYTDATHKPTINGVETSADEFIYDEEKEAIRWNVNDITENKKTLTYYVKLNDDVKNTDKLYETSNGIELNYTDSANKNQNVNLDIPEIKAMTGVIEKNYYLVNQDGSYIDAMGNVTSKEKAYLKTDVVVNQPIGETLDVYADETFDFEGKTYVGEKGSQQVKISWTSDGNAPVVGVDFTCTQPVKADFISEGNIFAQKNSVLGSSFGDVKTPNKEGYQFLGWYSEKDGKGTAYDSTATASGNAVYYAYYTPNRYAYSIHYYYDGIKRDEITGLQADYQTTITDFENRDGDGKYKLINQPSVVIGLDSSKNIMKVLYEINKYQVTFKNKDGNVITSMEVPHGSDATAPEAPEVKGYVFTGWDTPYTNVTSNLTVQALYEKLPEPENYLVTFIGYQGELLDTQTVQQGQDAKAPVAPEVDGYTFTGWDKAFTNVQSNLTVNAKYEINKYNVTFVNKDGKEITHMEVPYGSDAKAPNAPEVEGYTFTKWDKDYTNVKSDLTVQAVYEINKYNVTFVNKDGIEITHMEVPYGSDATAPEAPEVDGYVFKNWDKDYSNVKSDLIVQAIYEKLPDPVIYKVEFIDKDGKEIETQYIKEGGNATAPNAPKVEGYTFTNWDKDYSNVKSDLTVQAVYEINTYKVTFIDKDGKEITYVEVSYGSDATAPKAPKVEGYTFKNWDKDYKNVKSDLTVQAVYEINKYKVTFVDKDGKEITHMEVPYGSGATAPEAPEVDGYVFKNWDKDYSNVKSDLTVQAVYEKLPDPVIYKVEFIDKDGKEIETQYIKEGGDATAPKAPKVEGYSFKNWDKDYTNVKSDLTVQAVYEINTYKVTFIDKEGKEITHMEVPYGADATAPNAPKVEGYTFKNWDKDYMNVKSDLTVQAVYEINTHKVTFIDKDGKEITQVEVPYGSDAKAPNAPKVEGYTFKNWDKDYTNVKSDLTVQAEYEINTYKVTFIDKDGKEITQVEVPYGSNAKAPNAPKVDGYTFTNWDKDFNNVKSDLTVQAEYEINTYKVTFIDRDGKEITQVEVPYGSDATAPNAPEVDGYTFTGWDKEFKNVREDLIVQALYSVNRIDPVEPVNPVTPQNPQNPQTRTPIANNNNETPYLPNTEPQEIVNQNETPKTDGKEIVKESKTPKASGDMYWALFNLLFAAGTLILGIFLLLCKLNKEEEDEDDEDKTIPYKRRKWLRIVTSVVAVAAVIIFVITEDITLTMRYTDKWTLLMAVVFLGQVIFFLAARKWKEVEEEEETKRS